MTFRRLFLAVLVLAVGLTFSACNVFSRKPRPAGPAVTGTVVYITNVQLPADATVDIRLVELDRDGAQVRVLAEDLLPRPRRVPMEFSLLYRSGDIRRRGYYGVDAKILSGGRVIFAAPRPNPVLTHGNPSQTEIVVEPAK